MTLSASTQWSNAQLAVNESLAQLVQALKECSIESNEVLAYDRQKGYLSLDNGILSQFPTVASVYQRYVQACEHRHHTVESIQNMPKMDLGFPQEYSSGGKAPVTGDSKA